MPNPYSAPSANGGLRNFGRTESRFLALSIMVIMLFCVIAFFGYGIRQILCMGTPPPTARFISDSITVGFISTFIYLSLAITGPRLFRDFDGRANPFSLHVLVWLGIACTALVLTYACGHVLDPFLPDFWLDS